LFATRVESVPTIDYFKSIRDMDNPQSLKAAAADLVQLPICNSIALPLKIAEFILYLDESNAPNVYKNLLQFCINEEKVEHPSWIEVLNDSGEDPTQELEYKMTTTHLSLLQHLYTYSKKISPASPYQTTNTPKHSPCPRTGDSTQRPALLGG
jgi:hypothetical protein